MIRSSTMAWIPHNFDPEAANTFLNAHIGPASTLPRDVASYDCFTAPRNRQNRAGVRLRGSRSIREGSYLCEGGYGCDWRSWRKDVGGRKEKGLFSRSLELVIRMDGHHWNPLTASLSIPDGEPDDVSKKVPYLVSVATLRRTAPQATLEIVRRFHEITCVLRFMSRWNVDRAAILSNSVSLAIEGLHDSSNEHCELDLYFHRINNCALCHSR